MSKSPDSGAPEAEAYAPSGPSRPAIPPEIQNLFGKRPLITGEDVAVYDGLLAGIARNVSPSGHVEWLWVKDILDLAWEARRLRRLKAGLLQVAREEALAKVLLQILSEGGTPPDAYFRAHDLANAWVQGETDARRRVGKLLRENDLDIDAVMAQALSLKLNDIERIDRMIGAAESRRDKVLREIETRRDSLARRLRQTSDELTDVDTEAQA
jgi:hypothetical protein